MKKSKLTFEEVTQNNAKDRVPDGYDFLHGIVEGDENHPKKMFHFIIRHLF